MDAKVDKSRGFIKEGEAIPEKRHPSTPRTQRLKQVFMDEKPTICAERNVLYTESYQETEALQPVLRQAKAFEKTLDEMPMWIRDEELIVSNLASRPGGSFLFPFEALEWFLFLGIGYTLGNLRIKEICMLISKHGNI